MKSQKSLNNIASADLKRSFASNLVIPALTFLAFTVQAAVCAYFQFKQKEKVFFTWFRNSPDSLVFISFCIVLVGAIQAAYTLRFINIKNQSNVWFSFNLSRSTLFKNRCVSSLTLLGAAIIIPGIISAIICCASGWLRREGSPGNILSVFRIFDDDVRGLCDRRADGVAHGSVAESIFYSVVLILGPAASLDCLGRPFFGISARQDGSLRRELHRQHGYAALLFQFLHPTGRTRDNGILPVHAVPRSRNEYRGFCNLGSARIRSYRLRLLQGRLVPARDRRMASDTALDSFDRRIDRARAADVQQKEA